MKDTLNLFSKVQNGSYRESDGLIATYDKNRDEDIIHGFNEKLYDKILRYKREKTDIMGVDFKADSEPDKYMMVNGVDLAKVDFKKVQQEVLKGQQRI